MSCEKCEWFDKTKGVCDKPIAEEQTNSNPQLNITFKDQIQFRSENNMDDNNEVSGCKPT